MAKDALQILALHTRLLKKVLHGVSKRVHHLAFIDDADGAQIATKKLTERTGQFAVPILFERGEQDGVPLALKPLDVAQQP
jgi:hypothetical protein